MCSHEQRQHVALSLFHMNQLINVYTHLHLHIQALFIHILFTNAIMLRVVTMVAMHAIYAYNSE